jgi:amino acid adenylation domain-containing protein
MQVDNVEDLYKLSNVQQDVLSQCLSEAAGAAHARQSGYTLKGTPDQAIFAQAWQQVVARHAVLRTAFYWENLDKPLQVVARRAELSCEWLDWRDAANGEPDERLQAFLSADRRLPFDLNRAPLMRLAVIRIAEESGYLILSYHRLILDERSAQLVLREAHALYETLRLGTKPAPPKPAASFKDYVSWLRRQDSAATESFWRRALEGFGGATTLDELQERRTATLSGESRRSEQQAELSAAATRALRDFAEQLGLSLESLLQGAWALLLSLYTDEPEVTFGAPVSGRPSGAESFEKSVGAFAQVLPLGVRVPREARVSSWLESFEKQRREVAGHQHAGLDQLREWGGVSRDGVLFESVVQESTAPSVSTDEAGASLRIGVLGIGPDSAPLVVSPLIDSPGAPLSLLISYDASRFEAAFVNQVLRHLATLLESIVARPEARIADLSLLSEAERQMLFVEWNGATEADSDAACVHELFEAQVESRPDATAVVAEEGSLTYRELNERANRLAHYLRGLGVGPEVPVGLCMARSLDALVGLLGTLKAGGVYLPLDPEYPQERLSFMLEDANVSVLLTHQYLLFDLPVAAAASEVVCLDSEWDAVAEHPAVNPASLASTHNLAYVIFTSGSTGRPKGVSVPHGDAARHLRRIRRTFGMTETDRVLQFASLNFDVSVEQLLTPLCCGATVFLRAPYAFDNPADFFGRVEDERLTVVNVPPPFWGQLTQSPAFVTGEPPATLRLMIVGGDAMPAEALRRWRNSAFRTVRLLNAYGPTETIITAAVFDVPPESEPDATLRGVPIGRGVGGRQLYVLNGAGRACGIGVRGELHIGGLMARGYLGRPELTAERFVPDAFGSEPGARLYRTGDMVRWTTDGVLEFFGRTDAQVKVRGYRIEVGEVEAAIGEQEWVREVAVAAREGEGGDKRLVAYVVAAEGEEWRVGELRDTLREKLPDYMLPSAFVNLATLPLTPNGKLDRRALPEPDAERPELKESFVAAGTPTEEKLVELWAEVLGVSRIGVNDNFFDLGGDSLLATQLMSRVQKTFQVEAALRDFFDAPTIADLAQNIEAAEQVSDRGASSPIRRNEGGDLEVPPPLSFAQERLWFMSRLDPRSPAFNIPASFELKGTLDVSALEQTFGEIVRRHEALRTTFDEVEGAPVQLVNPAQPFSLPVTDLGRLSEPEQRQEVARRSFEEVRRVFDLRESPLVRASLLRLEAARHVLLLTMHHIASDGWSIGLMAREVAALYEAFAARRPSPLAELPIQYADFARWQREWLQGEVLARQLDYWRGQLGGSSLPVLQLPTDRPRPARPNFLGATVDSHVPASLSERLKTLGQQEGATLFMVLLASFQTFLHHYTKQEDIIVGTDLANRNRVETEELIGFFVNLLPLRVRMAGSLEFREALRRVREVTLGAYAHQDIPFDMLVAEFEPERTLSRTPLFQVLFVMQNTPMPRVHLSGLELTQLAPVGETAKFDLALFVEETDEGLVVKWNYREELFEASTVRRMAEHFRVLLESIAAEPEARLAALELRTPEERAREASEQQRQKAARLGKLRSARRIAIEDSPLGLVRSSLLPEGERMPLVFEPALDEVDLAGWVAANRAFIQSSLHKHGALLFRNFGVNSVVEFERCAASLCPELFSEYGDLPREEVSARIYGSTPYPSDEVILFHNESSHLHRWPMKIMFYCVRAAEQGGETPIADCRTVLELLSPRLRARFAEKKLMYVRNYTPGLDVSWENFFHTTDRAEVERQAREAGVEWEWKPDGCLQTRKLRTALSRHPQTGEEVFFNQVQLHHVSCLEPSVRESLLGMFGERGLPRNVYYGDGSPIEEEVMAEVGQAYNRAAVNFTWRAGDLVLLDNMLCAHGRNRFVGERKIVVAMGEVTGEEHFADAEALSSRV